MKKLLFTLILLGYGTLNIFAQEEKDKTFTRWYFKPGAGVNLPLTQIPDMGITDDLIDYNSPTYYLQFISAAFFPYKHWGIEFTYQGSGYSDNSNQKDFEKTIEETYNENYYVPEALFYDYGDSDFPFGSVNKGYLALIYRIENDRLIFLPKIYFGIHSFNTESKSITFKEKGTHHLINVDYAAKANFEENIIYGPAFTFGYKINNFLIANFDINYSFFNVDITYKETITNVFTDSGITREINYNKNIHSLSMGLGMIIQF